ncbi:50S ribosomal protein L10 [Candidatus Roizmanbacteria bacterium RIFCSPHIGHO2_01_FULL_39_12c]|uniref:Large ribosomal subunit protein uL10 n=1 Tax=Candidatus Roizmanbacteria bacterium RIFCSPHIGHO2_01_FULL_39_12c TaxID=1802031 RepID=A0A1F7GBS1_9BACT|nr:MAG: 50S ribosomal protein L10 [Candidatus Roizmanbacteria bacterium RIFCSPHIGHO2_01_FULL_39_12c]OGK47438.1 MAG: 50S ribosomal protein L10 [Candidatus Roizmanbacteria bacterium RIFCSPLOWO2_01_FULL_40_13]
MINQKKQVLVQNIQDLLAKHQNFALVKIDKSTHQTLESLRKNLKKSQAEFKVVKNSLLEKSIRKNAAEDKVFAKITNLFFPLRNNSALLLLDKNWSDGLRAFFQFIQSEPTLTFKFGILDNNTYATEELLEIAKLPNSDELMARVIGQFKSPTARLISSLKFNFSKMVFILRTKSKQNN